MERNELEHFFLNLDLLHHERFSRKKFTFND